MPTNELKTAEDAEMTESDGEKVVTMMDVLQEQQEFEEDANAVLGASDEKNCTYSKGYIKRQAVYACLTCTEAKTDPTKRAGVCLACSLTCHENHELIELYTRRNFRCDCGNPKFNSNPCQFISNKSEINEDNIYNQNFSGVYCICHRPYPDPEATEEDEMIQCIICEDWLHASHLQARVPPAEQYAEMICKSCMESNEFLHDYGDLAVNIEVNDLDIDVTVNETINTSTNSDIVQESTLNGSKNPAIDTLEDINTETDNVQNKKPTETEVGESDNADNAVCTKLNVDQQENTLISTTLTESVSDQINEQTSATEDGTSELNSSENLNKEQECVEKQESKTENKIESTEINKDSIESSDFKQFEGTEETNETSKENMKIGEDDLTNNKANISNECIDNDFKTLQPIESEVADYCETETKSKDNNTEDKKDNVDLGTDIQQSEELLMTTNEEASTLKASDDNVAEDNNKEDLPVDSLISKKEEVIGEQSSESNQENGIENHLMDESTDISKEHELNVSAENIENPTSIVHESESKLNPISTETEEAVPKMSVDAINEKQNSESIETELNIQTESTKDISGIKNIDCSESQSVTNLEQNSQNSSEIYNKRKLSEEQTDDSSVKKAKLEITCTRPKGVKRKYIGATFWPSHFRQKLCTCNECLSMYKDLSVLFLIDLEDTVTAYENLGKEKIDGGPSTQYERGLEALSSLDRIQQINALTEYNKMRDKLLDFLKSFKDRKEIVKEEDIKAFFAGMKPKREPDGVYFCR